MKARMVPRNPFAESDLTEELATAIREVRAAPAERKRYVAYILSLMIESDSWDVILTPEQQADLQAALNEDPKNHVPAEEVWKRFGLERRQ